MLEVRAWICAILLLLPDPGAWASGKAEACNPKIMKALIDGTLDEATLNKLGYQVEKWDKFDQAIVKPMRSDQWEAAKGSIREDLGKIQGDVEHMTMPKNADPKLNFGKDPMPKFEVTETPNGFHAEGTRYIKAKGKWFRLDTVEQISRDAKGNVAHYTSVQVSEVTPGGLKKIAYSDLPHGTRDGDFRWFHAHDAATKDIVANIDTQGFTRSALPAVLQWAKSFVGALP